jgi:hypothetical protein
MNDHPRIDLTDNMMTAVMKLADGNPGAITALLTMATKAAEIDPDSAFGAFSPLFALDTHGIYGSDIWVLWKDVCGMDPVKAETLFRSVQLGYLPESRLTSATKPSDVDFQALNDRVCKELPAFARLNSEVAA